MNKTPQHLAFIMDGNGRWARKRKKARSSGHVAGLKTVDRIITYCLEHKVNVVSFYAFSTENWKRSQSEINGIFSLLNRFIDEQLNNTLEKGIRLMVSGDTSRLPAKSRQKLETALRSTQTGEKLVINICINYGAIDEMRRACYQWLTRSLLHEEVRAPTTAELSQLLYTRGLPPVDLVIRTGGHQRLSNFLLLQCAYAEIYFSQTLWPDFTAEELAAILGSYEKCQRNFGAA